MNRWTAWNFITGLSFCAEIEVAQGSVAVAVAFRGLPVYSETKDLCERTSCPVTKGPLNLSYDEYLPPIVPPVRQLLTHAGDSQGMHVIIPDLSRVLPASIAYMDVQKVLSVSRIQVSICASSVLTFSLQVKSQHICCRPWKPCPSLLSSA